MYAVILKSVSKFYKKDKKNISVLKNLNYKFKFGKMYAIMGPSGCGKSTLVNSIAGFISIDSGSILINGINSKNDKEMSYIRNKIIGLVYQNYLLNESLSVYDNVLLPLYLNKSIKYNQRRKNVLDLLEKLGLENRLQHYPKELSGGEQQRVCIARALINNAKIIICDEPTGNLDKINEKNIFNLLKKLSEDGKCVIVVTHSNEIVNYCDILLELKDGDIVEIK